MSREEGVGKGWDLSSFPGSHSLEDPRRITTQAGETEQTPPGPLFSWH